MAGWTIAVTTVPPSLLSLPEGLVRLRWHIGLHFQFWKQHGSLDEWRTSTPTRMLCDIYARLIGLLIQHWLLIIRCWHIADRSLVKAAKAVRSHVAVLSAALDGDLPLSRTIGRIQRAARAGARLNSRQDAPNTCQQMLQGFHQWSSKLLRPWKVFRRNTQKTVKETLNLSSLDAYEMQS